MSLKKDTLSGVKWSSIERFSVHGINFIIGILLARLLSPSDFGTVAMVNIFYAVSRTFYNSGFQNALIRKKERSEDDYCTVFIFNTVIAVVCYIILFIIAPWVAEFFNTPVLCSILRVQSVCLVINAFGAVQVARLTIAIDFKGLAKRAVTASICSGVTGVVLAYCGWGVWALVAESMVSSTLNMLLVWFYSKWRPKLRFSWKSFHEMFSYGSKLLLSNLLNTVYNNLTPLIIGRFFSAKDLGFYARGTRFSKFPVENINGVLKRVTFPILAKVQDDTKRLINAYRKYICMTSLCIFFACMLLAALSKPFILFLLTEKWEQAIIYLQIYSFSAMFAHVGSINLNLLQVIGRSDLFLRLEVIKKIISTAILFAAIPFGVIGICVSKIIYTQISIFINTYYTGKLFKLGYVEQLKDFSGFFFCSVIACVPAFLLTLLNMNHLLTMLLGIAVSIVCYWLMLRKNKYMIEVLDIVKSALPKRFRPSKK